MQGGGIPRPRNSADAEQQLRIGGIRPVLFRRHGFRFITGSAQLFHNGAHAVPDGKGTGSDVRLMHRSGEHDFQLSHTGGDFTGEGGETGRQIFLIGK